jgi:iron(II)-dependent oxidoreductase
LRDQNSPSGHWLDVLGLTLTQGHLSNLVIAFDQFEEFFSDLAEEVRRAFWEDVERCMRDQETSIRLVFSFRQEAFHLFKHAFPAIPKPYDVAYGIDSLTASERLEVITAPADLYGRPWDRLLVDTLMQDIARQPGETAHLSIVLTTLWDERRDDETELDTYERLGRAEGILTDYLWGAVKNMPEPERTELVLKAFVSPERRKAQASIDDLVADVRRNDSAAGEKEVRLVCRRLVAARLVKAVADSPDLYELTHDLLASTIGQRVTLDEMVGKLAKRSLREAIQEWRVTRRLPTAQAYDDLSEAANKAPLLAEDLLFLCLAAASSGNAINGWLQRLLDSGGTVDQFYSECVESDSLLAVHEVLRRLEHAFVSDKQLQLLERVARSGRPSLLIHLQDLLGELTTKGHGGLDGIRFLIPQPSITIPGGPFIVGYNDKSGSKALALAIPEHEVYLDEFTIDRFLVTNLDYSEFVEKTGHHVPDHWVGGAIPYGREYHPVTRVSWYDAAAYAHWLGKRLPTEAEWEKAAYWDPLAGRKLAFPWGDIFADGLANYFGSHIGSTSPIGQFSPQGDSRYGVADIAGNVFEWLLDDAVLPFRPFTSMHNPVHVIGDASYTTKVTRGGSYGGPQEQLHCAYRGYPRAPMMVDDYIGFRCASSSRPEHDDLMRELLGRYTTTA